jgi:hypothetical protein
VLGAGQRRTRGVVRRRRDMAALLLPTRVDGEIVEVSHAIGTGMGWAIA